MDEKKYALSSFLILVVFLVMTVPRSGIPQQYAGVKSVIVVDFYDKTGKFDGRKIADSIRNELAKKAKFRVLSKAETIARYKRSRIARSKMLFKNYRKAQASKLRVDAYVIGVISKEKYYKLTLKMEKARTASTINSSEILFKREVGPNAVRVATAKFLGLSYTLAPAPIQTPPPAPLEAAPSTPFKIETPPSPELAIGSQTKESKTKMAPPPEKVTRKIEKETAEGPVAKRDIFTIKLSPALYKNTYSVTNPAGSSTLQLINVNTGFFPNIDFAGELWFLRFLGLDFFYDMGWLNLTVTPSGGSAFNVSAKFSQLGGGLKYRLFLSKKEKSPYVTARVGYSMQTFSPGTQTTTVLSKNRYSDLAMGVGMKLPFWFLEKARLGLSFGFDYFIISKLKESVINNGTTNSSKGYQFSAGPYWNFFRSLFASFDFVYNYHGATFSAPDTAQGTRTDAVAGAKSKDKFMGLLFSVGYNM